MASSSSKYFSLYFTQNSVIVFTFIINSTTSWSFWILRPFLWNRICYFRGKKSSIQAVLVHTTLIIDDENPTRLWICNATFFPYSEQNQQNHFDLKKKNCTISFILDLQEADWSIVGALLFFIYCNWHLCSLKGHSVISMTCFHFT